MGVVSDTLQVIYFDKNEHTMNMKVPLLTLSLLTSLVVFLISCGDDDASPNKENSITSFSINGTEATINESSKTISLDLLETELTSLTPVITISQNAEVNPASGVSQDFTNPVIYTVTAEDGGMETYTVTVTSLIRSFSFNGQDYEIVLSNMSWVNAAAFAVSRGGFLAEINGADEQDAVFGALTEASISIENTVAPDGGGASYVWIGGNDLATEGEWLWDGNNDNIGTQFWMGLSDGTAVGSLYNNWGNEPDDFGSGQDGLGIALTDWPLGVAGQWNDIDHTNELYFVIELN